MMPPFLLRFVAAARVHAATMLVVLSGVVTSSASVFAASPLADVASPQAKASAKEAMRRGIRAAAMRDWQAATGHYREAIRLVPQANVPHRYLAEALVAQGRDDDAVGEYEAYLALNPDVADAAEVRARIEQARARRPGKVSVEANVAADVFFDDAATAAGTTPLPAVTLPRGEHALTLRARGFRERRETFTLDGDEVRSLRLTLEPLPQPVVATPPAASTSPRASTRPSARPVWSTVGIVTAATGGALLLGSKVVEVTVLRSEIDDAERLRKGGGAVESRASALAWQHRLLATYIAGGVLTAGGLSLFFLARKSPVRASVGLGGVTLHGNF